MTLEQARALVDRHWPKDVSPGAAGSALVHVVALVALAALPPISLERPKKDEDVVRVDVILPPLPPEPEPAPTPQPRVRPTVRAASAPPAPPPPPAPEAPAEPQVEYVPLAPIKRMESTDPLRRADTNLEPQLRAVDVNIPPPPLITEIRPIDNASIGASKTIAAKPLEHIAGAEFPSEPSLTPLANAPGRAFNDEALRPSASAVSGSELSATPQRSFASTETPGDGSDPDEEARRKEEEARRALERSKDGRLAAAAGGSSGGSPSGGGPVGGGVTAVIRAGGAPPASSGGGGGDSGVKGYTLRGVVGGDLGCDELGNPRMTKDERQRCLSKKWARTPEPVQPVSVLAADDQDEMLAKLPPRRSPGETPVQQCRGRGGNLSLDCISSGAPDPMDTKIEP